MPGPRVDGDLFEGCTVRGSPRAGFALRRCESRDDALDVVAETFAVVWRRRADIPADPVEVRPWLFGIARLCLANAARSSSRAGRLGRRLAESFEPGAVPDPATVHERSADAAWCARRWTNWRPPTANCSRSWPGRGSPRAGGRVLGITAGVRAVRLHRARTRLRNALAVPTGPEEGLL